MLEDYFFMYICTENNKRKHKMENSFSSSSTSEFQLFYWLDKPFVILPFPDWMFSFIDLQVSNWFDTLQVPY
jgi:hypothetical protein